MTATQRALARAMTERELSRCVRDLARALGWYAVSFEAPFAAVRKVTVLDLYLIRPAVIGRPGRTLWAELKSERGKLSRGQRAFLDLLASAGVDAHVWRPSDWLEGRIEEALR